MNITPVCHKTFSLWKDIFFLRAGVPLEQVSRRILVITDASKTGPQLHWHINCLELLTVLLALKRFRPLVQGKHVLVRTDNTATVVYINHQGVFAPFAFHNWPTISYSGVSTDSSLCMPLTSQANSIVWPMRSHDRLPFRASGDFTPRRSGFEVDALKSIRTGSDRSVCLIGMHPLPIMVRPGAYASMPFP